MKIHLLLLAAAVLLQASFAVAQVATQPVTDEAFEDYAAFESQPIAPLSPEMFPAPVPPTSAPASSPVAKPTATQPWFETALTPGIFSTTILPKFLPKPDPGFRLCALDPETAEAIGLDFDWGKGVVSGGGMLVSRLIPKSDAARAGVVEGDILTAIDFGRAGIQPVYSIEDFDLAMEQIHPGDVVRLILFRRGGKQFADIEVERWDTIMEPVPSQPTQSRFLEPGPIFDPARYGARRLDSMRDWKIRKEILALKDCADQALIWQQYSQAAQDYGELLDHWEGPHKPQPAVLGLSLARKKSSPSSQPASFPAKR